MWAHVPCSLSDLAQIEHKLGFFSGDPTNYVRECDKILEITQGPDENTAAFTSCLSEAVLKHNSLDPGSAEESLLNIQEKLQQLEDPLRWLSGYSTTEKEKKLEQKMRDNEREERENDREKERQKRENVRYLMLATALQGQTHRGHGKGKKPTQPEAPRGPCFRCGKKGHWVRLCPNPWPPPGTCPFYKKTGHWKVESPSASS